MQRIANDPAVVNSLKQLEQDMGDAMVRVDVDKLNQIYADDFATLGSSGKMITKKDLLRDFESGAECTRVARLRSAT